MEADGGLVRVRTESRERASAAYQPHYFSFMPTCIRCGHHGREHKWRVPPCVKPGCECYLDHPQRLRGSRLVPGCGCIKYMPDPATRTRVWSRLIRRGR